MYETLLADCTRVLGPDHPDTLASRINLARAHQQAGHLPKAIDMYETLLADCTRVLGPKHPHTLTTRNNLALAYRDRGNVPKAIALRHQAALANKARIPGPDHPKEGTVSSVLPNPQNDKWKRRNRKSR